MTALARVTFGNVSNCLERSRTLCVFAYTPQNKGIITIFSIRFASYTQITSGLEEILFPPCLWLLSILHSR